MTDKEKQLTLAVVRELPTQPLKEVEVDNVTYECLTVEEALTEILEKIRKLVREM